MSRTDRVLREVAAVLERRRTAIDGTPGLRRVEVIIKFHPRTGQPDAVFYRMEESEELTPPPARC